MRMHASKINEIYISMQGKKNRIYHSHEKLTCFCKLIKDGFQEIGQEIFLLNINAIKRMTVCEQNIVWKYPKMFAKKPF